MGRIVLHDAALADGTSASLRTGVSLAIEDGKIAWIRPNDSADTTGAEVVDAGGATIVPAMVDCHSHLTMQGGSHWIARGDDPPAVLRQVARDNAKRLADAGILWARDVGAPAADGVPLSIAVRDEHKGRRGAPYMRVAGTWIGKTGYPDMWVTTDSDGLEAAALHQLELGTDLVKLYMDGPDRTDQSSPFSIDGVRAAVQAVHARGAKVAAHSGYFDGARVAAAAGVDSIEHGMELNDDIARTMKKNDVTLVSTLSVFASWETFARTTTIDRFTAAEGKQRIAKRKDGAYASIAAARRAGVTIATGSDFGGGSVRAGHLAWEVELLVAAGLEPYEALASATRNGGALYGVHHAGRIDEGMPADLVLVHGDPLSDARALWRIWAVYQEGVRIA
ncbi:MAG TPA: amidohydrolase family protein [Candidatus Limnocylindria bacterium]|nr:amidohydrolase family protein [Candidatus Limnocylindria bacterium]